MPKLATPNPWAPRPEAASTSSPVLLLSQKEAATALSISTRTLYALTCSGEIVCVRVGTQGKGLPKYRLCDLEAFVNKNVSTATKEGGANE